MTPPDEGVDTDESKWVNLQDDAVNHLLWDLPYITQLYMLCCESGVVEVSLLWLREILHSQNPDMELFGVSALAHCVEYIVQLNGDSESLGNVQ